MKTGIKIMIAAVMVFAASTSVNGQIDVMRNYVFTTDSTAGFDEQAASAAAMANASYGDEYKVFMYRAKREFVKQKYNLQTLVPQVTIFQNPALSVSSAAAVGGECDNEDFELATAQIDGPAAVQGWSFTGGTNNNSCNSPQV